MLTSVREITEGGSIIDIPCHFGQYTYVRTLSCSMHSVLLLVENRSGDRFAAKVVDGDYLARNNLLEFFEQEVHMLSRLKNRHIVGFQELVRLPGSIALIMEYCEKGDLFRYLWHKGELPIGMVRSYLFQLLKGLEYLHSQGYAHRDLKPENIVLDAHMAVKICDLGFTADSSNGLQSTVCGSIPYMPPEMLANLLYDGRKADIWSLGIVAYVMATAQLPWASQDPSEMAEEILCGEMTFPVDFPRDLIPFVNACTRMSPWERPSAAQLMEMPWISEESRFYKQKFVAHSLDAFPAPHGLTIRPSRASIKLALPEQTKKAPPDHGKQYRLRLSSGPLVAV
jgi:serine/threonine protein kinase